MIEGGAVPRGNRWGNSSPSSDGFYPPKGRALQAGSGPFGPEPACREVRKSRDDDVFSKQNDRFTRLHRDALTFQASYAEALGYLRCIGDENERAQREAPTVRKTRNLGEGG